jgi:DNA-binding transcriptional ArsR family regulator
MARPPASEDVFRAIADPTRRGIIELLRERPRSAGEVAASFASCHSTVSEHLGILRRAKIVAYAERDGRRIYSLMPGPLEEVAAWSADFSRSSPGSRRRRIPNPPQEAQDAADGNHHRR